MKIKPLIQLREMISKALSGQTNLFLTCIVIAFIIALFIIVGKHNDDFLY